MPVISIANDTTWFEETTTKSITGDDIRPDFDGGELPLFYRYLGAILGSVITTLGIAGNLMMMVAMMHAKMHHRDQADSIYIFALFLADLVALIMVKSPQLHVFVSGDWSYGAEFCAFHYCIMGYLQCLVCCFIVLTMLQRAHVVIQPRVLTCMAHAHFTPIAVTTVYLAAIPIGFYLQIFYHDQDSVIGYDVETMICVIKEDRQFPILAFASSVLAYMIVLLVIYFHICKFVRTSRLRVEAHGETALPSNASKTPTCYSREFRIAQSGCLVTALIIALHVPLFTVIYLKRSGVHVPYPVSFTVVMVFWFRYSVHWIIFGALNDQYQKAVRQLGAAAKKLVTCSR